MSVVEGDDDFEDGLPVATKHACAQSGCSRMIKLHERFCGKCRINRNADELRKRMTPILEAQSRNRDLANSNEIDRRVGRELANFAKVKAKSDADHDKRQRLIATLRAQQAALLGVNAQPILNIPNTGGQGQHMPAQPAQPAQQGQVTTEVVMAALNQLNAGLVQVGQQVTQVGQQTQAQGLVVTQLQNLQAQREERARAAQERHNGGQNQQRPNGPRNNWSESPPYNTPRDAANAIASAIESHQPPALEPYSTTGMELQRSSTTY